MMRLNFDIGNVGSRLEQIPKCSYDFVTVLNNTRFDFILYKGNSLSSLDIIGNCPAYTILTFPNDKLTDFINFVWSGGQGVATVQTERAQVFFTEENLGLVSQFRAPAIVPTSTGKMIEPANTPSIFNLSIPLANTEYSVTFPLNTKRFSISMRENDSIFRVAFAAGHVATSVPPFLSVPVGSVYYEDNLNINISIFIASPVAGRNIQIIAWS